MERVSAVIEADNDDVKVRLCSSVEQSQRRGQIVVVRRLTIKVLAWALHTDILCKVLADRYSALS
jgi:exosome complex RNA-binding protein Rrp42 (RNase PH superfamily)